MHQLRPHLVSEEDFLQRTQRMSKHHVGSSPTWMGWGVVKEGRENLTQLVLEQLLFRHLCLGGL